jgi:hypothetical protein
MDFQDLRFYSLKSRIKARLNFVKTRENKKNVSEMPESFFINFLKPGP